jgi:hypothetical protein
MSQNNIRQMVEKLHQILLGPGLKKSGLKLSCNEGDSGEHPIIVFKRHHQGFEVDARYLVIGAPLNCGDYHTLKGGIGGPHVEFEGFKIYLFDLPYDQDKYQSEPLY